VRTAPRRALALGLWLASVGVPAEPALRGDEFDCADAFDLFAAFVVLQCAMQPAAAGDDELIARAVKRLADDGLVDPAALAPIAITFCPLTGATGIVPAPTQMYLDDGLRGLSADGLAEVIAHEWVHTEQFERLGLRGFKCDYVRAMTECGGCQDRGHALEAEAYATQDRIREHLLRKAGIGH
jgi:hypothetical protein